MTLTGWKTGTKLTTCNSTEAEAATVSGRSTHLASQHQCLHCAHLPTTSLLYLPVSCRDAGVGRPGTHCWPFPPTTPEPETNINLCIHVNHKLTASQCGAAALFVEPCWVLGHIWLGGQEVVQACHRPKIGGDPSEPSPCKSQESTICILIGIHVWKGTEGYSEV